MKWKGKLVWIWICWIVIVNMLYNNVPSENFLWSIRIGQYPVEQSEAYEMEMTSDSHCFDPANWENYAFDDSWSCKSRYLEIRSWWFSFWTSMLWDPLYPDWVHNFWVIKNSYDEIIWAEIADYDAWSIRQTIAYDIDHESTWIFYNLKTWLFWKVVVRRDDDKVFILVTSYLLWDLDLSDKQLIEYVTETISSISKWNNEENISLNDSLLIFLDIKNQENWNDNWSIDIWLGDLYKEISKAVLLLEQVAENDEALERNIKFLLDIVYNIFLNYTKSNIGLSCNDAWESAWCKQLNKSFDEVSELVLKNKYSKAIDILHNIWISY